jgi:5-(carboxyamino)imidazole ribonucleotide mutase
MLQMPPGVPVATVGIDSGHNAAIMACQILSLKYHSLKEKMRSHKIILEDRVELEDNSIR